jgi:hypothetical protein
MSHLSVGKSQGTLVFYISTDFTKETAWDRPGWVTPWADLRPLLSNK